MKIDAFRLGMLRVPLKTPFKTALRTVESIEDVVLMLETDTGHTGYGSAPATAVITGDTHASIIEAIDKLIAPPLIGQPVANLNEAVSRVQKCMVGNSSAKAAVEMALYDLWGQFYGAPLYRLLGGGDNVLTTDITISVDTVDRMVADARDAIERGFETLKLKVGTDPELDLERIRAIHAAVRDKALIRLDANQGWTPKQAVKVLRALEESGVPLELVEQPVKAEDVAGMQYVKERVATPVLADESAFGPRAALELIQAGAADMINIKLMKTGGISNAIRIADLADTWGFECLMGCMLESSIGVAAAAHVAAARSAVITRVDLDAPLLGSFDPVHSGVSFRQSEIRISDAPGLGITRIDGLEELHLGQRHGGRPARSAG